MSRFRYVKITNANQKVTGAFETFKNDPQYGENDNTLNKLKDIYKSFSYIKKAKKGEIETTNYYRSFITLFPKDENLSGVSEAELKLYIEFLEKEKPDYLIFKIDGKEIDGESPIAIAPTKIEKPCNSEKITITCKTRFNDNTNKTIKVYAVTKQEDGTTTETLAGEITHIAPNSLEKKDMVIVRVKAINDYYKGDINFDPLKNGLHQCLVEPNIIEKTSSNEDDKFEIDLTSVEGFINDYTTHGVVTKTSGLVRVLWDKFEEEYPNYKDHFKLFFLDAPCIEKGTKIGGYSNFGANYGVMFSEHTSNTIAHETLHALNLPHTFRSLGAPFTYKAGETENIMDYSHHEVDMVAYYNLTEAQREDPTERAKIQKTPKKQYLLWYWQWKTVNPNIK